MQSITFELTASATQRREVAGNYFRLRAASAVNVRLLLRGRVVYEASGVDAGLWAEPESGFDCIEMDAATTQTVLAFISRGRGGYDRSQGDVNVVRGTGVQSFTVSTVGTTAADFITAASGRMRLIFAADMANTGTIFLGRAPNLTLATGAIRLEPGDAYITDVSAEATWTAIATVAGQLLRRMTETRN